MKHNYKEILDKNLSINSYLWPNDINPFEFIEAIAKARIKNIGLHTDFIDKFGANKLKRELFLNNINVTSLNSVGYFSDPYYFKQNQKILSYAKILRPDVICVITGGLLGGPNPISNEYSLKSKKLDIQEIRKDTTSHLKVLFEQAAKLDLTLGVEPIGSWEILKKGHFNSISSCLKLLKNNNHKLATNLLENLFSE